MIITVAIYIISLMFSIIAFILPDIQILPNIIFEMIQNFTIWAMELNSIFFFIDNILNALVFFLEFLTYFSIYKISVIVLNYFRGAEGI